MTAMHKQAFDYDLEESSINYGHAQRDRRDSLRTQSYKSTSRTRVSRDITDAVVNPSPQRGERTRSQGSQNTVSTTRSSTKVRASHKIQTNTRTSAKNRTGKIAHKTTTSSGSRRVNSKKTHMESPRSVKIDRAMQKRKKRLAEMKREHTLGGQIHNNTGGIAITDLSGLPTSRLRTRVRYLHAPEKTIVGRVLARPLGMVRKKVHFLVIIAGIFIGGLMLTLWLTSQSAMSAYAQERLSNRNAILNNYVNELTKELAEGNSSPVLMEKARAIGMVPVSADINVLQHKGNKWIVFGAEKRVQVPRYIPSYGKNPPPSHAMIPPPPLPMPMVANPAAINSPQNSMFPANSTPGTSSLVGTAQIQNPVPAKVMRSTQTQAQMPIPRFVVPAPAARQTIPSLPVSANNFKPEMPIMPNDPDVHDAPIQPLSLQNPIIPLGNVNQSPITPIFSPAAQAQFIPNTPPASPKVWKAPTAN